MASDAVYVLSTRDVAKVLGVKPEAVRSWRSKGIGPPYFSLPGSRGRVRYSVQDLEAWVAQRLRWSPTKLVHGPPQQADEGTRR